MARSEALDAAAAVMVQGLATQAALSPREAAEAAWYPGHPLGSVEAIERHIIARRQRHQRPGAHTPAA